MGVVGLAAFYRALAVGTMGIVGPISATGAIVPVVYGLARGERPAALQAVGIVVAVIGVIAASLEPLPEGAGRKLATGVGFALIAALGFGASLLGLNRVSQAGVVWGTLTLRLTVVPIVLVAALVMRPSAAKLRPVLPLLVATGLFDTGANLLYGASARHGLISVTSVLASLYPVVLVAPRVLRAARADLAPATRRRRPRAHRRRADIGRRLALRVELVDELLDVSPMSSRIGRTCSSGKFFGSVKTQLIRRTPGVTGQTSSLQVETAMSAHARSSASSLCGT